jgi:hypothetical protein
MFKDKTSKKRVYNKELSTLDAMHTKVINDYSIKINNDVNNRLRINELEDLYKQVNNLIIHYNKNNENDINYYNELWTSNIRIREDIIELRGQMKNVNNIDEIEYYENTCYILFNYYDMLEKQSLTSPVYNPIKPAPVKTKNKTIIDLFNSHIQTSKDDSNDKDKDKDKDKENDIDMDIYNEMDMMDGMDDKIIEKSSLVDKYLSMTNNNHIKKIYFDNRELCNNCGNPLTCLQHDAIMICDCCGFQEPLLVEQNRPILKQNTKDTSHFSYKRINHFREWCNQVQGKESTDIPNEVFEKILNEIKKEKIIDTRTITYNKMREILKRLRINKYYEHINYIINRINGIPTPQFSPELEEKLCNMFRDIQAPFLKHCPKDRKNFLSYSYVLYKFFQILGLNEYLKFFPLLKSREKLYAQDQIWKKICEELNYTVIPSL